MTASIGAAIAAARQARELPEPARVVLRAAVRQAQVQAERAAREAQAPVQGPAEQVLVPAERALAELGPVAAGLAVAALVVAALVVAVADRSKLFPAGKIRGRPDRRPLCLNRPGFRAPKARPPRSDNSIQV